MIHLKRSRGTPEAFLSRAIKSDIKKYQDYYKRSVKERAQERFRSHVVGDTEDTLECVASEFNYKCTTCETFLDNTNLVCDSWRPRGSAKGPDGEFSADHYWWLAYEWRNKYALCTDCDNYKGSWFPVEGARAPIEASYIEVLRKEKALLVDPCIDFPEEHFYVSPQNGVLVPQSKKGETTIEILKLNRANLVRGRKAAIKKAAVQLEDLQKALTMGKEVKKVNSPEKAKAFMVAIRSCFRVLAPHPKRPHVMVWRQLLITWLKENPAYRNATAFRKGFRYVLPGREMAEATRAVVFFGGIFKKEKEKELTYRPSAFCKPAAPYLDKSGSKTLLVKSLAELRALRSVGSAKEKRAAALFQPLMTQFLQEAGLLRLYPEKVEIRNFKSISKLSFDFKVPIVSQTTPMYSLVTAKEPWKFLLGENGVGKSSILQAISLVLCGAPYIDTIHVKPSDILRHGEKEGYVKIWFVGAKDPVMLVFNAEKMSCSFQTGSICVLGYGSTRVLPKAGTSLQPEERTDAVKVWNLFDYSVSLADANSWLLAIDNESFDLVAKALKDVLDLPSVETYFIRENGQIFFSRNHETLDQLSEGYRSIIALAVDIMKSLSDRDNLSKSSSKVDYEAMEGIVLVDEISSHLHPRWQMKIVGAFRRAFPKLQFIVTSHDPLALKGIESGEVLLLKREENGEISSIVNLPDPSEFRAEQLLTSEFFGLSSTLDPDLEIKFNTYHSLLAKKDRTENEEKQLAGLHKELKDKKHLGETLREELMYNVIDQSLADYSQQMDQVDRKELFQTTKDKVLDLWNNLYKEES